MGTLSVSSNSAVLMELSKNVIIYYVSKWVSKSVLTMFKSVLNLLIDMKNSKHCKCFIWITVFSWEHEKIWNSRFAILLLLANYGNKITIENWIILKFLSSFASWSDIYLYSSLTNQEVSTEIWKVVTLAQTVWMPDRLN